MKILVVGSGCREHAIVKSLLEDQKTSAIYTLPERISLRDTIDVPSFLLSDYSSLADYLKKERVELVVVGPEQPLVSGLSDALRDQGIKVFGPCSRSAQLEGSKIFAKEFMKEQKIPTASYHVVSSVSETLQASENFFPPYVLKADGLAGGKGVFICYNRSELEEKSQFLFDKKALGSAGEKALLEDFQKGTEISVFVITDGESYQFLPIAQDYKRLYEAQKGPNTGGMGAIAPVSISPELLRTIEDKIVKPTLEGLKKREYVYKGVLYLGLMIHNNFPKVLEYNARFGDPEAQVLLPLLDGSWLDVFYKTATAQPVSLKWKKQHSACVVLCAENYPEGPLKESPIEGLIYYTKGYSWFIHGSLARRDDQWLTKGGRVLNAVAIGEDQETAVNRAYDHIKGVSWPGLHYRKDIGQS